MEPLAVPFSFLRYILLSIDYQFSDRRVTIDVWERVGGLAPRLAAILATTKTDDRDAMVRAMNGAIKEWLRVQASMDL